ncbi:Uncharacterized protein APZ42_002783 [Daphnia magna]|uniref:Uncharacterized protein n=1 Tax=Daphnia magna TaxID=35525 RepID=A0A164I1N0_9CRUS|nr:Uncharacterized protein APZ42_002783 [Daphnia magna]
MVNCRLFTLLMKTDGWVSRHNLNDRITAKTALRDFFHVHHVERFQPKSVGGVVEKLKK